MKLIEVVELKSKLERVSGLKGNDLNFAIKKNIIKANKALAGAKEIEEEITNFLKPYADAREELFKQASMVDGKPKTKMVGKQSIYDVPAEKEEQLKTDLEGLKDSHQSLLDTYEEKQKDFQLFLKHTDSHFEIVKVKRHHVPADITTEDMDLIFDIIQDKAGV